MVPLYVKILFWIIVGMGLILIDYNFCKVSEKIFKREGKILILVWSVMAFGITFHPAISTQVDVMVFYIFGCAMVLYYSFVFYKT